MGTIEIINKLKQNFLNEIVNLSVTEQETRKSQWNNDIDVAIDRIGSDKNGIEKLEKLEVLDKKAFDIAKTKYETLKENVLKESFVDMKSMLSQHSNGRIGSIVSNLNLEESSKEADFIYQTNYMYKFDDNLKKLSGFLRDLNTNVLDLNRLKF